MKRLFVAAVSVLALAGVARADSYKIDPVHSSIIFSTKHFGATNLYGRFTKVEGTVTIDADDSKDVIDATVEAASVDTHNEKRDQHLKSTDFLSVNQFPHITFKSTSWKKSSDDKWDVTGDLTLHGVTKPVTVTLEKTGEGKLPNGTAIMGLETHLTINRGEYGITALPGGVGEQVNLIISLECDKQ